MFIVVTGFYLRGDSEINTVTSKKIPILSEMIQCGFKNVFSKY